METEIDGLLFMPFNRYPHRGLTRMADSLNVLKISMQRHHWNSVGSDDYPRIERVGHGGVTLSLGVSRRPFVGFISWASVHRADSAIIRLMHYEQDRRWIREYTPGKTPEPEFDLVIGQLFPGREREIKLDDELLVNAVLQHFANLFDLE